MSNLPVAVPPGAAIKMNIYELKKRITPGPWVARTQTGDRGSWRGKTIFTSISPDTVGPGTIMHPDWQSYDGDVWNSRLSCTKENMAFILHACNNFMKALEALKDAKEEGWIPEAIDLDQLIAELEEVAE